MWSETTDQDSTAAPVLESAIIGSGDDHVVVKLLTTGNVPASSGGDVLAKLLTPAVTIGSTSGILLGNAPVQGLRKIEPKPTESGNECQKLNELDSQPNVAGQFLGIKATRRGVKTCPSCAKKIGYRSKECKYCSPNKRKRKSKKKGSGESGKDCDRDITVEIGVVIDNETEVLTSRTTEVACSSAEEVVSEQVTEDSEAVSVGSYEPESQGDIRSGESMDTGMTQANNCDLSAGKRDYHTSLQDLIHTLLVQNQNNSVYVMPEPQAPDSKVDAQNLGSTQQVEQIEGDDEVMQGHDRVEVSTDPVGSPESACDANSVALFLGHLAQQHGKKMRCTLDQVKDNAHSSTTASNPWGCKTKYAVVEDDMSSSLKYRRIRPKSIDESPAVVEIRLSVDSELKREAVVESIVHDTKPIESQLRMLPGNATKRGVMPCQNCQSLIGCRSKVCKYCNFLINQANPPFSRSKKHRLQAVQLQIPSNSVVTVFSVRRSKVGPDHRCFVWLERSDPDNRLKDVYSCDHPPCVTARELGNKQMTFLCEHAKMCCGLGLIASSRVLELNQEKLSSGFMTEDVLDSLQKLNTQCVNKGVPLVQCVSDRTFAVVDQLHNDQSSCLATNLISFVHIRFERSKVGGGWRSQVFCSGRSCMAWNPVFSSISSSKGNSLSTVFRSVGCIHYSACLWAITSDEKLECEFVSFIEGVKAKVNSTECD